MVKLNVVASLYPVKVGIGTVEVLHDEQAVVHGARIKYYSRDISIQSAELLAIRDDIHFSFDHGFRPLTVESDASNAVNIVKNKCFGSSDGTIVVEVLDLFNSIGNGSCYFILHSGNKYTN